METFDGKVDPQRLAKLDKRIGPPEERFSKNFQFSKKISIFFNFFKNIIFFENLYQTSIALASVVATTEQQTVNTSESDNSQNENMVVEPTEPKTTMTPDNNKRNR